jgi:hypothetical protein
MRKLIRSAIAAAAIGAALLASSGCGSSDSLVRLQGVPHAAISKTTLNHWMEAMVGGDFRRSIATEGPPGLASEPANYSRCFASAKLVAPRSFFNQIRANPAQIEETCHQLYRSIKAQALSFLIAAQWTIAEGAEQGITATSADVRNAFDLTRKERYPTELDLHKYLTERHWSLADLLYQIKLNVLVSRVLPKFEQQVKAAGGSEQAYAKLALERYAHIIERTTCDKRYVVPGCSEYHGPPTVSPSPDVILKQLTGKQPRT